MIRNIIILLILILTSNIMAFDQPLDTFFGDQSNNNEIYNPTHSPQTISLVVYYTPSTADTGTMTISPDPESYGTINISDTDNDGYYAVTENSGNDFNDFAIDPAKYSDGTYTITVNVSGQSQATIQVKLDRVKPALSNMHIYNITKSNREDYYEPGDQIKVEVNVSDTNIDITGIKGNLANITNSGSDSQVQPDTYTGGKATWTRTAADVDEGSKLVSIIAKDLADNEYSGANGNKTIICDKTAPWQVSLNSPATNYHTEETRPTFSWNDLGAGSDEVKYTIYIDDGTSFASPVIEEDVTNNDATYNYQIMGALNVGQTYWWKVNAFDTLGHKSPDSEIRSIIIDNPPAPTIVSHLPTSNQSNVDLDTTVSIVFSKSMNRSSVESSFSLKKNSTGIAVSGVFVWSDSDKTATFTPSSSLSALSIYNVALTNSAMDTSGTHIEAPMSFQFTTRAISSTAKAIITPRSCFPNVDVSYTFTITPELDQNDTGIQKAYITVPTGFNFVSVDSITPSGSSILDGDTIVITLDALMIHSNQSPIIVMMTLHTLSSNGPSGATFSGRVDNVSSSNPILFSEAVIGDLNVVIQDYYQSIKGEVNPQFLKPGGFTKKVVHTIYPTFNTTDSGIDQLKITTPYPASTSNTSLKVDGVLWQETGSNPANYQYSVSSSTGAIEFQLGGIVKISGPIETSFYVTTPATEDVSTGGVRFSYQVKNSNALSWKPDDASTSPEGDSDNNSNNSNKLTIKTGYPCSSSNAEIKPLSVNANVTSQEYNVLLRPSITSSNIGISKVIINSPSNHNLTAVTSVRLLNVSGGQISSYSLAQNSNSIYPPTGAIYYYIESGNTYLIFNENFDSSKFSSDQYLEIKILGNTPSSGDSGSAFSVICDSKFEEASSPMTSGASDIDNDGTGSLTVKTLAAVNNISGEIIPAFVKPSTKTRFIYYINWTLDPLVNTGIDKIELSSINHTVNEFHSIKVNDSEDPNYTASITGGKLTLLRSEKITSSALVKIEFSATSTSQVDTGYRFTAKVDNTSSSNPVEVLTDANLNSVSGDSDTMIVQVSYPVKPDHAFAELSVDPQITNDMNTVAPESVIEYTYGIKCDNSSADFGYNIFKIIVPPHHKNIDISSSKVILNSQELTIVSGTPSTGQAYISSQNGTEGGTISVEIGDVQKQTSTVKIIFKAETPQITDGNDDSTEFTSFVSYSKAADIETQTKSAEVSSDINGSNYSLNVITVVVPASGLLTSITPTSANVNESAKEFTMQLIPQFKISDTGVDKIDLKIPSSLAIDSSSFIVSVNDVIQSSAYVRTILNVSTYEISITDFTRLDFLSSGTIKVEFKADTGSKAYVDPSLKIKVSADDTNDGKQRYVSGDDIELKIKGCAQSAKGYIYPNLTSFSEELTYKMYFDYIINTPNDHGFNQLKINIPSGFSNTSTNSDIIVYKNGSKLSSDSDYSLDNSSSLIQVDLNTKEIYSGSMEVQFKAIAPASNSTVNFIAQIVDSEEVNLYQTIESVNSNSFNVQVQSATLNDDSIEVIVRSGSAGYWKIDVTVPFNIKMNSNYGKMKLNDYELKKESFSVVDTYSVYKGYAYITIDDMKKLSEKANIMFQYGRDYSGQDIEKLEATNIPIIPGVKLGAFFNPILKYEGKINDAQILISVLTSTELTDDQISSYVKEVTGVKTNIDLTRLYYKERFTGNYFLQDISNGSVEVNVSIVDRYGNKNNESIGLIAYYLAPGKNLINSYNKKLTVSSYSSTKKRVLIMSNNIETSNKQLSSSEKHLIPIESYNLYGFDNGELIYNNKISEKAGWYYKKDNKNVYCGPAKKGKVLNNSSYFLAIDNIEPKIEQLSEEQSEFLLEDNESGINENSIKLYVNGKSRQFNYKDNILSFNVYEKGNVNIELEASDNAKNKVVQKSVMKVVANNIITNIQSYPNPADTDITFRYSTEAERVELKIYDVSGDIVYTKRECNIGNNVEEVWDLTNNSGSSVHNGVYFYVLKVYSNDDTTEYNGKLVILK